MSELRVSFNMNDLLINNTSSIKWIIDNVSSKAKKKEKKKRSEKKLSKNIISRFFQSKTLKISTIINSGEIFFSRENMFISFSCCLIVKSKNFFLAISVKELHSSFNMNHVREKHVLINDASFIKRIEITFL